MTSAADAPGHDRTAAARWLLLAHQLPARPSNGRVKTWRRLQQIGALPTRNSVYVLPNSAQCREDFAWIRSEIVALGGQATVFAADALDADGSEAIVTLFQHTRAADYRALKREADKVLSATRGARPAARARREAFIRTVRALRERLADIQRIDFCQAPGRDEAETVIARLEALASDAVTPDPAPSPAPLRASDYRGRRWVTRPRPGVDRMSSAWLIRRYVDPAATFAFVERPAGADVPFDMYVGEFTHQGSRCTFETLAERFGVRDPIVARIGQIVHDLDMKEIRYGLPEAPTIGRLVDGLRLAHTDDAQLLELGIATFEALARSFDLTTGGATPARKARKQRR